MRTPLWHECACSTLNRDPDERPRLFMQILRFLRWGSRSVGIVVLVLLVTGSEARAQQSLTWDQVKLKFEAANPTLKADEINVQEMKAEETTAFLRPNPGIGLSSDGLQLAPHTTAGLGTHWLPLTGNQLVPSINYLHERQHKRELRLETAKDGTEIAGSQHEDLERNLIFDLRSAFVQTLQAKAVLELAKADLEYYDKIIDISRNRFKAGDIAKIDLARIELLRVQYEVEIETATVNLRTAKIQLMQLIDERSPVDQFDVTGHFDWSDALQPLNDYHQIALDNRPDLTACGATSHFPTRCTTAFDGATSILMSVRGTATVSSRTLRPARPEERRGEKE